MRNRKWKNLIYLESYLSIFDHVVIDRTYDGKSMSSSKYQLRSASVKISLTLSFRENLVQLDIAVDTCIFAVY